MFNWTQSEESPAAGVSVALTMVDLQCTQLLPPQVVVGGAKDQPVMIVSGLVKGVYTYTLTVTNSLGVSASDSITVRVLPNPMDDYVLQVHLEGNVSAFSLAKQVSLPPCGM